MELVSYLKRTFGVSLVVACLCMPPAAVFGQQSGVTGVVYPDIREPYRSVFNALLGGIKAELDNSVQEFRIAEDVSGKTLTAWIQQHQLETLIVLGKQGLRECSAYPAELEVIVGAVLGPANIDCRIDGGVALAPSPDRMFGWLKQLSPETERVIVVYNDELNGWLIKYARQAADVHGLNFEPIAATDLQEAAKLYRARIEGGLNRKDAIWLLQDPYTVDDATILPELLKASWDDEFIVFSSNPAHIRRGALFALYPDNLALGRKLGILAKNGVKANGIKNPPMQPLTEVLIAVNLRTADHLNLGLGNRTIGSFDLTFPASY